MAHHEEAILDLLAHEAGEGLECLAHGAITDDDDAAARQALLKAGGVPRVQLARVRLEDLAELLHVQSAPVKCGFLSIVED